jgi:hypothetical protein
MTTKGVVGGAGIGVASLFGFADDGVRMASTAGRGVVASEVIVVSGTRGAQITFKGDSGLRAGTVVVDVPRLPPRGPSRHVDTAQWVIDGIDLAAGGPDPDASVCVETRGSKRACR